MPTTILPQPSALSQFIASGSPKSPYDSLPLEILHNLRHQHNWTDLQIHPQAHPASSPHAAPQEIPSLNFSLNRPPIPPTYSTTSHSVQPQPTHPTTLPLLSGRPPKEIYIHPDLQAHLVLHNIDPSDVKQIQEQHEFVLPLALPQKISLHILSDIFDCLPRREEIFISADTTQPSSKTPTTDESPPSQPVDLSSETPLSRTPVPSQPEYRHRDAKRILLAMLAHNGRGGDGTVVYYIMQEGEVKPRQN